MGNNYLPTDYQNFIALSRYSRWIESENRRETWAETVARYFDFMERHLKKNHDYTLTKELRAELEDAVLSTQVMPSMRALMTAGPALERDHVGAYNCSYIPIDSPRAFDEMMYVLMCGTGVGFSVERQVVSQLPTVNEHFEISNTTIVVEDSKAGWCRALRELLAMLYAGQVPDWDVSKVRHAGARLKTFGGRASGPGPLEDLFRFCVKTFRNAAGRKLTSLECHDIACKIGEIVVVGGVRRSALISLSNLSDERMRKAKAGAWWEKDAQRALANNSAVYTDERPEMSVFMDEWKSLYESRSGERGIFSRYASWKKVAENGRRAFGYDKDGNPVKDWSQRDKVTDYVEFGTNPCCVTGETPILTSVGHVPIQDVIGKTVSVWNGIQWVSVIPFSTGRNPLVRVELSDGTHLDCTPYHKFVLAGGVRVQADELVQGDRLEKFPMPFLVSGFDPVGVDAYSQGFYSGDGSTGLERSYVYEPKYPVIPRLKANGFTDEPQHGRVVWKHGPMLAKDWVPVNASANFCLEWLAGLIDSDGTATRDINGNGIQIASTNREFLLRVRLMLTRLGVRAKVCKARDACVASLPDGRGGEKDYECERVDRLLIGNMDTYSLLKNGLKTSRVKLHSDPPQRDARRFVTVDRVVPLDRVEETFCFTDPTANLGTFNGIVTGQSEIILKPNQYCNLAELVVRHTDTLESLKRKARLAAILGTFQSTLTNFKYIRKIWKQNCDEERLLGVSLTGILDHPILSGKGDKETLKQWLEEMRAKAVETNAVFAKEIGVNQSTAVTAIKPSGTVSQLCDSASGIHPRFARYYIRRVRQDAKDPLTQLMRDAGVPNEPDVMKPNDTVIFSFPMRSPDTAVLRDEMTAIEQLELWLTYFRHWCEHKPSITVYVREHEWMEVGAWCYKHFDELTGVSFLPYDNGTYRQAPYEEITKEAYEDALSKMPKAIDWNLISKYEKTDTTSGTQELACVAGGCEIT